MLLLSLLLLSLSLLLLLDFEVQGWTLLSLEAVFFIEPGRADHESQESQE